MRSLKTLRVYGAALAYYTAVSGLLKQSSVAPGDADQLRRSAKSIGDNIAEGHGYGVGANRIRFFRIARGSAHESLNQLRNLANDGHIPRADFFQLFNSAPHLSRRPGLSLLLFFNQLVAVDHGSAPGAGASIPHLFYHTRGIANLALPHVTGVFCQHDCLSVF